MPRWFLVAFTLYACVTAAPAAGSEEPIYRCVALEGRDLGDDGRMAPMRTDSPIFRAFQSILVDTTTGAIRVGSSMWLWQVAQKGSTQNDFVAVAGPSPSAAASNLLRIRHWQGMETPTFFMVGLTMVVTGTCEPVR